MQWDIPAGAYTALSAPVFQFGVTLGVVVVFVLLWQRFGRPHFAWWAAAMGVYAARLTAILAFLATERPVWLFAHQVATGWTAVVFLYGATVFARTAPTSRGWLALGIGFPLVWSYIAIYRLDHFLLAAIPAVAFLSAATLWTAWVFLRHHRRVRARSALFLSATFAIWALHHLDYPFLRARGVWNPWGYYLDVVFVLCTGVGILFLVQDDLHRGLSTLSALAADLRERVGGGESVRRLLERPLALPGVTGTALYRVAADEGAIVARAGRGVALDAGAPSGLADRVRGAVEDRRYEALRGPPFVTVLPLHGARTDEALLVASDVADPFTALDPAFLTALGRQVGAALDSAEMTRALEERTGQLERLTARLARAHEDERRRLSRNLHDETAQVFAALNLELGSLREGLDAEGQRGVERALELVAEGIASIRDVTDRLRPSLLDDLGALPALEALISEFSRSGTMEVRAHMPPVLPNLSADAELVLYRALQEGLSNAARHADATRLDVELAASGDELLLRVRDDGRGIQAGAEADGTGLAGMRERLAELGGTLELGSADGRGCELVARLPVSRVPSSVVDP